MTVLALGRIIFTTLLILFSIAILVMLTILYIQLREMRRQAAQGNQVRWYTRSTVLLCVASPLFLISDLIEMAIAVRFLPENVLLYILIAILLVAALSLMFYSFKLSWGQIKSRL